MSRRKYIKTSKSAELDRMLVELFRQLWCDRVELSGKVLMEKVQYYNTPVTTVNDGWRSFFKKKK